MNAPWRENRVSGGCAGVDVMAYMMPAGRKWGRAVLEAD